MRIWKKRVHQVLSESSSSWPRLNSLVLSSSFFVLVNMKILLLLWLMIHCTKILLTYLCAILQKSLVTREIDRLASRWNFIDEFDSMITLRIHDGSMWVLTWCLFLIRLRRRWMLRQWKRMFFLFWINIPHLCSSNSSPLLLRSSCITLQFYFNSNPQIITRKKSSRLQLTWIKLIWLRFFWCNSITPFSQDFYIIPNARNFLFQNTLLVLPEKQL